MPYPTAILEKIKELGRTPTPDDFTRTERWAIVVALKKCILQTQLMIRATDRNSLMVNNLADDLGGLEDDFEAYALSLTPGTDGQIRIVPSPSSDRSQ